MTWWRKLPDLQKAAAAILAIVCSLIIAGAVLADFMTIPERVEKLEESVNQIDRRQRELLDTAARTNCYLDNLIEGKEKRCP